MTAGTGLRWTHCLGVALAVAALTFAGLSWWDGQGHALPRPSLLVAVSLALIGAAVLVMGRAVRRFVVDGPGAAPRMTSLRAFRVLVVAQAAALTGSGFAGWYAGVLAALVPTVQAIGVSAEGGRLGRTAALLVLSIALAVIGLVVQSWCKLDDDEAQRRQREARGLDGAGPLDA